MRLCAAGEKSFGEGRKKSGLLKRGSYLDCCWRKASVRHRMLSPLSVVLLQFGRSARYSRNYGEAAIENVMEKIGQQFAANIRTNDLAFRYGIRRPFALILGDTAEKEALLAVEKLRKVIAEVRLPSKDESAKGHSLGIFGGAGRGCGAGELRSGGHCDGSDQPRRACAGDFAGAGAGEGCGAGSGGWPAGAVCLASCRVPSTESRGQ